MPFTEHLVEEVPQLVLRLKNSTGKIPLSHPCPKWKYGSDRLEMSS